MKYRKRNFQKGKPMRHTAQAALPRPMTSFGDRRLAREWKTVSAMIRLYCRDNHRCVSGLCPECADLHGYVNLRLDRCHFGQDKPTCARCPVHCYQKTYRDRIKTVMRYAGPRMLWEHPILSFWHLMDGWFRKADKLTARA